MDAQILAELRRQREIMEQLVGMNTRQDPAPPPAQQAPVSGLMSDYDCLVICVADDVVAAIDRWNRSRRMMRKPALVDKAA